MHQSQKHHKHFLSMNKLYIVHIYGYSHGYVWTICQVASLFYMTASPEPSTNSLSNHTGVLISFYTLHAIPSAQLSLSSFCLLSALTQLYTQTKPADTGFPVAALWHSAWLLPAMCTGLQLLSCSHGATQMPSHLCFSPSQYAAHANASYHYEHSLSCTMQMFQLYTNRLLSVITMSHGLILMMLKNTNYISRQ